MGAPGAPGVCFTVNDTDHRVGTKLVSVSYVVARTQGRQNHTLCPPGPRLNDEDCAKIRVLPRFLVARPWFLGGAACGFACPARTHVGACKLDCSKGDGKTFATTAGEGGGRPVAALAGGLAQCQQECELAEAMVPGSCAAIVHDTENSLCSLVNR